MYGCKDSIVNFLCLIHLSYVGTVLEKYVTTPSGVHLVHILYYVIVSMFLKVEQVIEVDATFNG